MKFKDVYALVLLSISSVYFLCPVLCPALREADCGDAESDKASIYRQSLTLSQTTAETDNPTCCHAENQPVRPHESQNDGDDNCCLNRWELLGASEPQLVSQIQKGKFSFVALIPAIPKISSDSVSFTSYLQFAYKPYKDSPTQQISPRAPPFPLT